MKGKFIIIICIFSSMGNYDDSFNIFFMTIPSYPEFEILSRVNVSNSQVLSQCCGPKGKYKDSRDG